MAFEIVTLKSGLKSLRALDNRETFHPVTGPRAEAEILHVAQQRLVERAAASRGRFVVWDVGFGAAANVLAAIDALADSPAEIEIHSFDKSVAPIEFALSHLEDLSYLAPHESRVRRLLSEGAVSIASRMHWILHLGDFRETLKDPALPSPHAVLYDPYSPVGNPEMWSLEHFTSLRSRFDPDHPCLLTNYTRSTAVRVTLLLSGFFVGIGSEIGEKSETTLASNRLELLERPLGIQWLSRVRKSGNAAPLTGALTGGRYAQLPISEADLDRLCHCPQFRESAPTGISSWPLSFGQDVSPPAFPK